MHTEHTHAHGKRRTSLARQSVLLPIRLTDTRLILYHSNTHDSAQAQSVRQNFRYGFDMILLAKGFPCAYTFWRTCANKVLCAVGRIVERKCRHKTADLCADVAYCLKSETFDIKNAIRIWFLRTLHLFCRCWPKEEICTWIQEKFNCGTYGKRSFFSITNKRDTHYNGEGQRGVALLRRDLRLNALPQSELKLLRAAQK